MTTSHTSGEYRYIPYGAPRPCPTHPGCTIARCQYIRCSNPIHRHKQRGRPRRYCSTRCRVADHRLLN